MKIQSKLPLPRQLRIPWSAILLAAAAAAPLAAAAPVTWTSTPYTVSGSYGQTLNTGLFVKTGTQILAENVGGNAVIFDGINFTAGTTVFAGGGSFNGFHESTAPLSGTGTYGNTGPSTVTLTGLTSGNIYRVQALVYDGRGSTTGRTVKFDGINQGQYANGVTNVTWGNGLLVTGTPTLTNPVASAITNTTAQASADLSVVDSEVTIHWDTVDQDTGTWTNSNPLGAQVIGPVAGAITGLAADTQYFYRFHAVNTAADPDTETWSTAGTSFATALTGLAPSDPSATTFSKTEIDIAWSESFNTETEFVVERSLNGVDTWTQAGTAPANSTVFYDSNLLPGTTYFYRILARNGTGLSDPSAVVSATTSAPDPGITVQAWFRMGDAVPPGANNLPTDSTVNARNFTVKTGATDTTVTSSGGGYNNDAYYTFNGVDQSYNSIGYDPPENNVGVEVWVRTSDLAQTNKHIFGTGANTTGLNISYDAAGNRGWSGAVANVSWVGAGVGTANYTTNTWIHLAVVRDNGITTLYVNGVASGTSTSTPLNATLPRMAATYNNGAYFSGDVAEARIFTFDPGQFHVSHLLYPGTPPPSDPYAAWAATFPGLANPAADLDFDKGGLSTGVEWVTGGDPSVGNDDSDVAPTFSNADPANFLFTFRRRDTAAGDAGTAIVVEYANDLGGWRNSADHGAADGVTIDETTDLGGGFHQVTVSIPRTLAGTADRLFARLKVTRN